jgi:hypothetical protein
MPNENPTNVTNTPISKSFKGILRISNNNTEGSYDSLSNKNVYAHDYKMWEAEGTQQVSGALTDGIRYITSDSYTNLKIPVTDSMGNTLNFAVGGLKANNESNGTCIGTFEDIGAIDMDTARLQFTAEDSDTYPSITTPSIYVGYEGEKIKNKAQLVGSLNIDSYENKPGTLAISTKYYHSGGNITSTEISGENKKFRVLYQSSTKTSKKYDAVLYNQENYRSNIDDDGVTNIDCYVDISNLRELCDKKISEFLSGNASELPSGTILWQYCSIDKWFCKDGESIDETKWQGYLPAMTSGSLLGSENIIDNAYCSDSKIQFNNKISAEIPPDFKRGYVLCDGGTKTMKLYPLHMTKTHSDGKKIRKRLDLFFNLFYSIGYFYTSVEKIKFRHVCRILKGNEVTFAFDYPDKPGSMGKVWSTIENMVPSDIERFKNTIYACDMALICAFKAFDTLYDSPTDFNLCTTDGKLDADKMIKWLKDQAIPEKYIFGAIFGDTTKNVYYKYEDDKLINIGNEINKFTDIIPYYSYNDKNLTYHEVEIYKMAEIRNLAELFANTNDYSDDVLNNLWNLYTISYDVPKMYMKEESKEFGLFPGSSGLSISEKFTLVDLNLGDDETGKITSGVQYNSHIMDNYCRFNLGNIPHYHYTGVKTLIEGNYDKKEIPISGSTDFNSTASELSENNSVVEVVLNSYTKDDAKLNNSNQAFSADKYQNQYILQGLKNDEYTSNVYNYNTTISGVHGQGTVSNSSTYRWYGATSGPISSKNSRPNTIFRPKATKLLPLIKL